MVNDAVEFFTLKSNPHIPHSSSFQTVSQAAGLVSMRSMYTNTLKRAGGIIYKPSAIF